MKCNLLSHIVTRENRHTIPKQLWVNPFIMKSGPGPNFIIEDLPSVLILIIADQMLNDSLCCSNKYNWCVCRFI